MFQRESLTHHDGYAAYRPSGRRDLPDAFAGLFAVLAWCRDHGTEQLLVDTRGLTSLPNLSVTDRLDMAQGAANVAAGKVRLAMIAHPHMLHPERMGTAVANSRGLRMGIFTNEVEALDWLAGPEAIRPVLETERLALRWLTRNDAAFIQALVNQPSWLRFIGERNVHSPEDAIGYIEKGPRASYAQHGFGLWCVERKEDGTPIGMCGLLKRDHLDHPDIGFAYLERYQGQGYGSEAALAVIDHARTILEVPRVLAVVDPANAGSIKILRKLGMGELGPIQMPGDGPPIALFGAPV